MTAMAGHRWAARTAISGTVFIALGAFWLSFTALADLAARSGIDRGQAWVWPLIVDGIIVVATVSVVALGGQKAAWYPWMLLAGGALISVTANAIHAVIAADADVPSILAGAVAAVPPVVLLAITHLTVILTRPPSPVTSTDGTSGDESGELVPVDRRDVAEQLRTDGWSNKQIARELGVHPSTVGRWFTTDTSRAAETSGHHDLEQHDIDEGEESS